MLLLLFALNKTRLRLSTVLRELSSIDRYKRNESTTQCNLKRISGRESNTQDFHSYQTIDRFSGLASSQFFQGLKEASTLPANFRRKMP